MYTIIDGTELNDKRLRQALELDRSVYPENYLLDEAVVFGYWREHPEIYICACDGDDLVAYLNVSCIDGRSYRKLCSGTENDLCIRAENIRVPDANGVNYMYLSSVVVRRDRRKIGIAEKLLRVFADRLEDLRDRGIYFSDMIADAISEHGKQICRSLGMTEDISTSCGGRLFRYPMKVGEPNEKLDMLLLKLRRR